jgi:predicted acetyltransferase
VDPKERHVNIRLYDPEKDFDAVHRIWSEVGWLEADSDNHKEGLRLFASDYEGLVAVIDGEAECYVATGPGTIRHSGADLPLSVVAAVTTSHIARRQGLAQKLTTQSIARDAERGALVSALGMFDQGFYDKLGYGTGGYEHWHSLDPADLRVPVKARPPQRLSKDDWELVHKSRLNRRRGHGACNIDVFAATQAEMLWASNGFGFGYPDGPDGEVTHHIWFSAKEMENGPLNAWWMAYQTPDQFLELMALISNLGDQVHLVKLREPAGIQIQDLIRQPFRRNRISKKSPYESLTRSLAYWQMRICDLEACLAATHLDTMPVRFNLDLTDPISSMLDDDAVWRGVGGRYVVELGPESSAEKGSNTELPTLKASVGAFTRLWLGVQPASGLTVTDDLNGSADLLGQLDRVFRLPVPSPDWDF